MKSIVTFLLVVASASTIISYTSVSALSSPQNNAKPETSLVRRAFLASSFLAGAQFVYAQTNAPKGFKRIPTQFVAALGDPNSNSGTEARDWGLWPKDPGPRGVWLDQYEKELLGTDGVAPTGWKFDPKDWWLEEHGLIMESPEFPLPAGRYLVTGGRLTTTVLNVDDQGGWNLEDNAELYDVTHLPCRSARYHPVEGGSSPLTAKSSDFPVKPGSEMPPISGCSKQDYAVLFVIGIEAESKQSISGEVEL